MRRLIVIALILMAAVAIGQTVDYETQIQPIFDQHCVSCHGGAFPQSGMDLSGGASLDNLVGTVSSGYAPALRVVRGDPGSSVISNRLNNTGAFDGVMPPTGKITQEQIDLIDTWIVELLPTGTQVQSWGSVKARF